MKNKESYFISKFQKKHIGDDGAVLNNYVYVVDGFFENVHFKREWFSLQEIAYKSVLVNLSDIYSMGSIPKYALLTVAIPKNFTKKELDELSSGFLKASQNYNFEIIGGDTLSNNKLDISVTMVGKVSKSPIYRKDAKSGDLIAHTGKLGESKRDLEKLLKNRKIRKNSRFRKPKIRDKYILKISKYISAGLDISDGLFSELEHLSKSSQKSVKLKRKFQKNEACSGEEYEFLFTFPKRNLKNIFAISKHLKTPINIIGKVKKGKTFQNSCKRHHF
jgi:thiamine-monophosphate kinase